MNPSLMSQLTQGMAQGSSPMNTVTPAAPTYQPSLAPTPNTPMPDRSPVSAMHLHRAFERRGLPIPAQLQQPTAQPNAQQVTLPVQDQNPQQAGVQIPMSEAELIIKALSKRLDHHTKTSEKILDAVIPQKETV